MPRGANEGTQDQDAGWAEDSWCHGDTQGRVLSGSGEILGHSPVTSREEGCYRRGPPPPPRRRTSAVPLKPQLISKQVQSNCALFFQGLWLCLVVSQKEFSMSHHPVAQAPVHTRSPEEDSGCKWVPGVLQTGTGVGVGGGEDG